ncbi:hypothetical protein DMH88_05275 [Escherichia coli]|nr:hypothetical protein [Escherichia coli]
MWTSPPQDIKKGPKAQLFCSQITKNPDKSGLYITEPYNRNCGLEHFQKDFSNPTTKAEVFTVYLKKGL